jgi:hypothetical protein
MWFDNVQNMRWYKVLAYNVKLWIPIQQLALGVIHWFGDVQLVHVLLLEMVNM